MPARQKVSVRIEAEDRASSEVQKVEGRFTRLGNFLKRNFVASAAAATAAVYSLVKALKSVISAASTQEDAVRALDAALASLGTKAQSVSKNLQEQARALQQLTIYGDETIIRGQALIATFTKDEDAIKRATEASLNMAAGLNIDLNTAFMLMARAAGGATEMLSRYGIMLGQGLGPAEKFSAALDQINQKWGGQAQAQAETFSGQIKQLGNEFSDVLEKIGFVIIRNDTFLKAIRSLTTVLRENATTVGNLSLRLVSGLGAAMAAVGASIVGLTEGFYRLLKATTELDFGFAKLIEKFPWWHEKAEQIRADAELLKAEYHEQIVALDKLGYGLSQTTKELAKVAAGIAILNQAAEGTKGKFTPLPDLLGLFDDEVEEADKDVLGLTRRMNEAAAAADRWSNSNQGLIGSLSGVSSAAANVGLDRWTSSMTYQRRTRAIGYGEYTSFQFAQGKLIYTPAGIVRQYPDGRIEPA